MAPTPGGRADARSSRKKGAAGGAVAAPSLDDIKSNQSQTTYNEVHTFDALCSSRGEHGESCVNLTNCFGGTFNATPAPAFASSNVGPGLIRDSSRIRRHHPTAPNFVRCYPPTNAL